MFRPATPFFSPLALAWAEVLGARDMFIGVNALDYSGYPDCRPEFIEAFEHMAALGTKAGVEGRKFIIHTPLIHLNKARIIKKGLELGVDFSLTSTCYDPSRQGEACGKCDACLLRLKGFAEAELKTRENIKGNKNRSTLQILLILSK